MILNLLLAMFSDNLTKLEKRIQKLKKIELEKELEINSKKYLHHKDSRTR